jgi:hypothetical protein
MERPCSRRQRSLTQGSSGGENEAELFSNVICFKPNICTFASVGFREKFQFVKIEIFAK